MGGNPMTLTVKLDDVRFHARHGLFDQETRVGNEFSVSVAVTFPWDGGNPDDSLDSSISYADIFEEVRTVMDRPAALLETVAASIAGHLLARWPQIASGTVTVCKLHPPIASFTGSASVSLDF